MDPASKKLTMIQHQTITRVTRYHVQKRLETMQCGLKTHDQYDTCRQISLPSRCDAFQCRASEYCLQLCSLSNCGSLTCDGLRSDVLHGEL